MIIEWGSYSCDSTPSLGTPTCEVAELDAELAKAQAVMNTLKAGPARLSCGCFHIPNIKWRLAQVRYQLSFPGKA